MTLTGEESMHQKSDDALTKTVEEVLRPEDLKVVERAAEAMEAMTGRLSEEDVRRLASAVAVQVVAAHGVTGEKAERVKSRVQDIVYQLALGVAGSALYSLLAYFANMITFSFSGSGGSSDPVKGAARYELLEAVEQADRAQFTKVLSLMPQLVGIAVYKQVSAHDQFKALMAELDGALAAPAQESSTMATLWSEKMRAWFRKPAPPAPPTPIVEPETFAHKEADAITKGIWFGLMAAADSGRRERS
jgi:hypothetical protein